MALAINKIDALPQRGWVLPIIDAYRQAFGFQDIFPISAMRGIGTEEMLQGLGRLLPEGPPLFPPDVFTDQAERSIVAELIREKVLRFCRQEVPYSTAVVIDEVDESERGEGSTSPGTLKGLVRIMGTIFVERDSQKGIVIGKGGAMLKKLGTEARRDIERLLAAHVYLELTVRVEPEWSQRPDSLSKMGYTR